MKSIRKYLKLANFFSKETCSPCYGTRAICCKQVNRTATSKSNETNETFDICHLGNSKSKYVIYLLECSICITQYVGKSKTPYHIRLNNYRKDIKNPSVILACKHFNSPNHDFNMNKKSTIIELQRNITSSSTKILKERLKQR